MNDSGVDIVHESRMNSLDGWDYSIELACLRGPEDLQLAAELGKNLLERNKELENIVKLHQSTVEEQAQEIEYMKKQTAALREVNDSRLKIYEQLEVSIQDLERANHRLVVENTGDKKLIKSQCLTIENLEARCDELQKRNEELVSERDALLRRQASSQSTDTAQEQTPNRRATGMQGGGIPESAAPKSPKPFQEATVDANVRQLATALANDEEVTELLRQLQEARSQRAREQEKVSELGQQLTSLLHENTALEEQLNVWRSKAQDVKNLQEEINTLEEVRRGQLCGRCLRVLDGRAPDEISVMLDHEEFDDISVAESLVHDSRRDSDPVSQDTTDGRSRIEDMDVYKELEEKYQALIKVQRNPVPKRKNSIPACVSLQEELEMSGEFNGFQGPPENSTGKGQRSGQRPSSGTVENGTKKPFSATPTDFSEAETSSSGFLEETSNKSTQTDDRPGSFLCSIADGDDCKFSIYDDNSPFESRFRNTPKYRQLFVEIFEVLKHTAEEKEENEKLAALNDSISTNVSGSVSQGRISDLSATQDDAPSETTDDNVSVMSSIVSSVVSEPLFRVQTPILSAKSPENREEKRNGVDTNNSSNNKHNKVVAPQNGSRLEYLSVNVNVRKKSMSRKSNGRRSNDRPATSDVIPTTNPKFVPPRSSSRRKFRPFNLQDEGTWNGHTQYIYSNRTRETQQNGRKQENNGYQRSTNEQANNSFEYADYKPSTASEEVARLRRLEMSYAEALRTPNKSKVNHRRS